jgi:pyruvate dehydrogenase E1 component beta subunit
VLGSVQKTGRVVVVHEAPMTLGIGAEVAATIVDRSLDYLKAPIKRVAGYDTIIPLAKLEDEYIPSKDRVVKAAVDLLSY